MTSLFCSLKEFIDGSYYLAVTATLFMFMMNDLSHMITRIKDMETLTK